MMGYGSYGHGGFSSSSSSNLSALAPPFTVSPKPNSSPLVDLTEPSYGVPLNSSLHNWLPSHYPNSGPGFFSNHNSEFNPMASSNAFSYPGLQAIEPPNTHLPPANPIASASADAFLGGQCSDGVATSLVEDKRYYPTYAPPAIQDHGPLVAPDETSYDSFSSSRAATFDGSSNNDYIPGLGYTADWGESWNRLGDWEHGKRVEHEGICPKGIYKNNMNQGAHASKGLSAYEEASHIIDMFGWEKHGGSVSMERSNDKSFSGKNPRIMPVDYSKTSFLGSSSLLPENHPKAPASSSSCQVPYSASFEKHMRQHDASPRDDAPFMTSSPSLVIRPPDIDTSFSAPNNGPLKDANFGTDAADPDPYGNNPSNVNEFFPLLSSNSRARFDTSQVSIHLDRNDPISGDSFSAENEKMPKDKIISEDVLDQVFQAKYGLQISHTSSDGFNLALDFIEAINPVENSSESLDHYNPAVDSPCWKGAPVTCFSPFEASKAVNSQYMKKLESFNSSDFQVPQFFHLNVDDAVNLSSQNLNEKTAHVERGLRPNLKRPLDANSLFSEPRLDDSAKAGSFHSKSSCGYEVQHSDNICEPEKDHALPSKPTGDSDLKPSLTMQQKFEASEMISENKHSSETCVADLVSNIVDFAKYGSSDESCHATVKGLSSASSMEDASSKLTKLHEADSTPKIDVQMLVNTMRSLSDVLLFHSSNDSLVLKEGDLEALKDIIFNLHRCILKDNEQIIPTQESLFPQQGTSQDLEELPKLSKEVCVDRHRLRKEAAVIAQDQLDHQCLNEEKRNDIGPGNKMEMASDSVSLKGDMAKEDNMTQAIMKVLSENFDYEEETESQSLLYKNLWLEAEAELCSINYKARYNRMKIEMEKSESHKAKENTMDVEEKLEPMASHDIDTVDKLAPETKAGPSPDFSIQYTPPIQNVIARYGILKRRIDYSNPAVDVEELSSSRVYRDTDKVDKLASEAKSLTQDSFIKNSPVVSSTCYADDVLARFHILKRLVDNSNSVKATDIEEPSSSSVSPDLNKVDKLAPEATEAMGTLIPDIFVQNPPISTTSCHTDDVEASVMARFNILKHRDDNLSSTDFKRQELSEFDHSDDVEASVMAWFNILKHRDDNLSSTDFKRQELSEFDHLGFAGERIHRPIIRDGSEDGSMDVKLGPVLQHHTASSTEDELTVKEFHRRGDDPVIQSCPSNGLGDSLPASSYDSTSSDWEHVMKEELVG